MFTAVAAATPARPLTAPSQEPRRTRQAAATSVSIGRNARTPGGGWAMGNLTLERTVDTAVDQPAPAAPAPAAAVGVARSPARRRNPLVWLLRLPIALPFVLMSPELLSVALGRPGAVANVSASA